MFKAGDLVELDPKSPGIRDLTTQAIRKEAGLPPWKVKNADIYADDHWVKIEGYQNGNFWLLASRFKLFVIPAEKEKLRNHITLL